MLKEFNLLVKDVVELILVDNYKLSFVEKILVVIGFIMEELEKYVFIYLFFIFYILSDTEFIGEYKCKKIC